jgi:hypothetical protein
MVQTVNKAFSIFLRDNVNLDSDKTQRARSSRDWLLSQIHLFPSKDLSFPRLYSEKDIFFGSFARRTKKRELDDIDMMIALSAEGGIYHEFTNKIEIYVSESAYKLKALCFDNTNTLSSRKVINKFISLLNQVPQYEKAEIKFNWASLNCGVRVEPETIIDASNRYKRKNLNFTKLQNWYSVSVGQLPIQQARIICQRSNVWWDAQLRRRYSKWIIIILVSLTIIVLLIGLIGGLTLEKFLLAVLVPLIPAFVFGLRQYTEHNEAATRLDRLRENAEVLVQEVISGRYTPQDLERESYSLQTQIYDNRRRSPLILDWLYSRLRNKDEEQMNKGAESLIKELTQNP